MGVALVLLPPNELVATAEFIPRRTELIDGDYLPTPISDDRSDDGDAPAPEWSDSYPRLGIQVVKQGEQRGYRLAKIAVWPVRYDGHSRMISLVTDGTIRIQTRRMTDREVAGSRTVLRESALDGPWGSCRASIAAKVANGEDLDRWYPPRPEVDWTDDGRDQGLARDGRAGDFITDWPSLDGLPVPLIIITNNYDVHRNGLGNMAGEWRAYARDVYDLTGIPALRYTVDEIEARFPSWDRAHSIQLFIADCVRFWGTMHVLLGGDIDVVPTRRVGGPSQDDWRRADQVADYWYSRVSPDWMELWNEDHDEWFGESEADVATTNGFSSVIVGRVPARDWTEVRDMRAKLMSYRRREGGNDDFFRTALLAAGMADEADPTLESNGIFVAETSVAETLGDDQITWQVTRLYPDMHGAVVDGCECYEPLADAIDGYLGAAPYWSGDALRDEMETAHVVFHVESSLPDRLGRPRASEPPLEQWCSLDPGQREQCRQIQSALLRNTIDPLTSPMARALQSPGPGRYSWVISVGGWTATTDRNAVGEELLRAPDGGAIGYIGRTAEAFDLSARFVENLVDALFVDYHTAGVACGEVLRDAIEETYSGSAFEEILANCEFQLLGDPSLTVAPWHPSGPSTLAMSFSPSAITTFGMQDVGVTVTSGGDPVEGATVTLRQAGFRIGSGETSAAGFVRFAGVSVNDPAPLEARAFHPGSISAPRPSPSASWRSATRSRSPTT